MIHNHIPVLLNESVDSLNFKNHGIYLDCTFGRGGHARKILESNNTCILIAIDRDVAVFEPAKQLKIDFKERFLFINCCFSEILNFDFNQIVQNGKINIDLQNISVVKKEYLKDFLIEKNDSIKITKLIERSFLNEKSLKKSILGNFNYSVNIDIFDGILLDLGLSSPQIDIAENGFSYMKNGDLNMQMGHNEHDAQYVVNNYTHDELFKIIKCYSDERNANNIAKEIVNFKNKEEIAKGNIKYLTKQSKLLKKVKSFTDYRGKILELDKKKENIDVSVMKINTTFDLVSIIKKVTSQKFFIKTCSRVFQAIRMHVNNEIGELIFFLYNVKYLLKSQGVLSVISFHSIEDKIIKSFLKNNYLPILNENYEESCFKKITREKGSKEENIRARSSILRFGTLNK